MITFVEEGLDCAVLVDFGVSVKGIPRPCGKCDAAREHCGAHRSVFEANKQQWCGLLWHRLAQATQQQPVLIKGKLMVGSRVNFTKEDIGGEILPILTTGLYRNTLDALREYIQNAVDAEADDIELVIDPDVVSLTDNGTGMVSEQARNAIRFGVSDKSPLENVGFRGIGIYSGFNICDSLEVYTKAKADGNTYKLMFDFYGIRTKLLEEQERRSKGLPPALHLERLLEQSVFMESLGEEKFSPIWNHRDNERLVADRLWPDQRLGPGGRLSSQCRPSSL